MARYTIVVKAKDESEARLLAENHMLAVEGYYDFGCGQHILRADHYRHIEDQTMDLLLAYWLKAEQSLLWYRINE